MELSKIAVDEFQDYKSYLLKREENWPTRGMRRDLAQAMHCQAAYVSQILNGSGNFSLEQIEAANRFLSHSKWESHFFLLLVQEARAGSAGLKSYFQKQIQDAKKDRLILKNRLEVQQKLRPEDQVTYYSHASYALVHVAVTIEKLQTLPALKKALYLPEAYLQDILEFLLSVNLVEQNKGGYQTGSARVHLGNDSKLIGNHHRNWRLKAMENLEIAEDTDLHYSSITTLKKEDFLKIRESLAKSIESAKKTIRDSPPEELAVLNIDFFQFKK